MYEQNLPHESQEPRLAGSLHRGTRQLLVRTGRGELHSASRAHDASGEGVEKTRWMGRRVMLLHSPAESSGQHPVDKSRIGPALSYGDLYNMDCKSTTSVRQK